MANRNIPVKELNELNAELEKLRAENAELRKMRDNYDAVVAERDASAKRVGTLTAERDQLMADHQAIGTRYRIRNDGSLVTATTPDLPVETPAVDARAVVTGQPTAEKTDEQLLEENPRVSKTIVDRPQGAASAETAAKDDGMSKEAFDAKWDAEAEKTEAARKDSKLLSNKNAKTKS